MRQVQEMELAVRPEAMRDLLQFLQYSFGGGTDVDRPLELSLQRLEDQSWNQVRLPVPPFPSPSPAPPHWQCRSSRALEFLAPAALSMLKIPAKPGRQVENCWCTG